jgi:predicted enzyme related to lactoylglutathione lyase
MKKKGRIIGIGGIFFKTKDPKSTKQWYSDNLGLITNEYGATFIQKKVSNPDENIYLQWSPFEENTNYFDPSKKDFMINYRVENIVELVEELKEKGVTIIDEITSYDYGKFVHILDHEGNAIELWEPIDKAFDEFHTDISELNKE